MMDQGKGMFYNETFFASSSTGADVFVCRISNERGENSASVDIRWKLTLLYSLISFDSVIMLMSCVPLK